MSHHQRNPSRQQIDMHSANSLCGGSATTTVSTTTNNLSLATQPVAIGSSNLYPAIPVNFHLVNGPDKMKAAGGTLGSSNIAGAAPGPAKPALQIIANQQPLPSAPAPPQIPSHLQAQRRMHQQHQQVSQPRIALSHSSQTELAIVSGENKIITEELYEVKGDTPDLYGERHNTAVNTMRINVSQPGSMADMTGSGLLNASGTVPAILPKNPLLGDEPQFCCQPEIRAMALNMCISAEPPIVLHMMIPGADVHKRNGPRQFSWSESHVQRSLGDYALKRVRDYIEANASVLLPRPPVCACEAGKRAGEGLLKHAHPVSRVVYHSLSSCPEFRRGAEELANQIAIRAKARYEAVMSAAPHTKDCPLMESERERQNAMSGSHASMSSPSTERNATFPLSEQKSIYPSAGFSTHASGSAQNCVPSSQSTGPTPTQDFGTGTALQQQQQSSGQGDPSDRGGYTKSSTVPGSVNCNWTPGGTSRGESNTVLSNNTMSGAVKPEFPSSRPIPNTTRVNEARCGTRNVASDLHGHSVATVERRPGTILPQSAPTDNSAAMSHQTELHAPNLEAKSQRDMRLSYGRQQQRGSITTTRGMSERRSSQTNMILVPRGQLMTEEAECGVMHALDPGIAEVVHPTKLALEDEICCTELLPCERLKEGQTNLLIKPVTTELDIIPQEWSYDDHPTTTYSRLASESANVKATVPGEVEERLSESRHGAIAGSPQSSFESESSLGSQHESPPVAGQEYFSRRTDVNRMRTELYHNMPKWKSRSRAARSDLVADYSDETCSAPPESHITGPQSIFSHPPLEAGRVEVDGRVNFRLRHNSGGPSYPRVSGYDEGCTNHGVIPECEHECSDAPNDEELDLQPDSSMKTDYCELGTAQDIGRVHSHGSHIYRHVREGTFPFRAGEVRVQPGDMRGRSLLQGRMGSAPKLYRSAKGVGEVNRDTVVTGGTHPTILSKVADANSTAGFEQADVIHLPPQQAQPGSIAAAARPHLTMPHPIIHYPSYACHPQLSGAATGFQAPIVYAANFSHHSTAARHMYPTCGPIAHPFDQVACVVPLFPANPMRPGGLRTMHPAPLELSDTSSNYPSCPIQTASFHVSAASGPVVAQGSAAWDAMHNPIATASALAATGTSSSHLPLTSEAQQPGGGSREDEQMDTRVFQRDWFEEGYYFESSNHTQALVYARHQPPVERIQSLATAAQRCVPESRLGVTVASGQPDNPTNQGTFVEGQYHCEPHDTAFFSGGNQSSLISPTPMMWNGYRLQTTMSDGTSIANEFSAEDRNCDRH